MDTMQVDKRLGDLRMQDPMKVNGAYTDIGSSPISSPPEDRKQPQKHAQETRGSRFGKTSLS